MAQNEIPQSIDPLLVLGEDAADGALTHAVAVGITQNTEAKIRADVGSLQGAQNLHLSKRAAKVAATAAKTAQDSNAKAFIASATGVLKNYLGTQWAPAWQEAGF